MKHRIYLQIFAIFSVNLFAFTIVSALILFNLDSTEYEGEIFERSSSIANLLIPPADLSKEEQQKAINRIAQEMEINISLFTANKELIVAIGDVAYPTIDNLKKGMWVGENSQTRWTTVLRDGRWLVATLDQITIPDEWFITAIFLCGMALLVALTTYPFIRKLTGRIERLQESVKSIGAGDLSARVKVEGHDEVALLAKSFNATAEKLEKLMNAQKLLLANASHEFRTPLSRIRLGIEMLDKEDSPRRRETLRNDIQELDELLHELMLMTRLDSDIEHNMEMVDLMGLVAEEALRYKGCLIEGTPLFVNGNLRMLQHLVRNLIENAFKHGKEPVKVSVFSDQHTQQLVVMDGGGGIPESEWNNVFQPFYRGKNKQNVQGFGLGLAIIKKIAEVHGATVTIKNDPTSTITVSFPAVNVE